MLVTQGIMGEPNQFNFLTMILKVIYDVTFFLQDPVVRTLCLSETCMIERDPATYIIVSCHPLSDVSFKC